jgi:16S rRNA (guanine966-N2)-methyltransferase
MRVVGGRLKGRVLLGPKGQGLRPTADRLRESLFNILEHGLHRHEVDFELEGARVLDLFAGTGALAIEAMSRGAGYAVMVDMGIEARGLQRGNVEALGLGGITRVLRRDATKLGPVSPFDPFTLIMADPPYGEGVGEQALASALAGGWIARGAIIVLEERAGLEIALPPELTLLDQRDAGEGQILIATY